MSMPTAPARQRVTKGRGCASTLANTRHSFRSRTKREQLADASRFWTSFPLLVVSVTIRLAASARKIAFRPQAKRTSSRTSYWLGLPPSVRQPQRQQIGCRPEQLRFGTTGCRRSCPSNSR
ncbi:hypothetical protein MPNT_20013 [Candidatus Methylacidithermus pantelleriae]|uniref:Uncharacterized protein n=1 Tax=Candidatus Methylacidithermus pantelleriae TaxID=2744239 RepID=A0A8J2BP40_9BACT|nr:hypothetical protein MPNT_20013 [Candidatus Methylacidithermus pantelleriae]